MATFTWEHTDLFDLGFDLYCESRYVNDDERATLERVSGMFGRAGANGATIASMFITL